MNPSGKFLIDSNVFIEAKNFAYNFHYCKIFWDFLLALHGKGLVYSINAVKKNYASKRILCITGLKMKFHHHFLKMNLLQLLIMRNLLIGQ